MSEEGLDILELLEENMRWWEDAASGCERTAVRLPPQQKKQELFLMCAVYRKRAHIHERLIAELSRNPGSSRQRSSQDHTEQGR
jgi:hypothetical protein